MGTQQFCLKWNNHQANMVTIFEQLLSTEALVDVTIACDGLSLKAHKMVLSACSPYFQSLFLENPCKHPIVIMKDMKYTELKAIIDFMYRGEVNVSHDQLNALLKTAETLKVKGLAEVCGERTSGVVQQETQQNAPSTPVHTSANSTPVIGGSHIPTRTDSPTLLSKRKRGRPRKRSLSDSNRSDDEQVPAKIKEPGSPDIEEISADTSLDTNISENNISSNSQTHAPVTQFTKSSIVQSHHEPSKSIQPAAMECQVEEPPSDDCDFELEPSKLMEQTLSTDVPKSAAAQNISSVQISSSNSVNVSTALVPVSITPDFRSSQIEDPESPQDIKPVLLTFEEPPVAGTSQDSNSMMYMESSGVPSIPSTSFQDSESGQIVQHDSQQGTRVHFSKFLSDHLKSSIVNRPALIGTKGYQKSVPLVVLHPLAIDEIASSQKVTIRKKSLSESQPLDSSASVDSTSGNTPTSIISREEHQKLAKVALNVLSVAGRSKSFHRHKVSRSKFLCDTKYPVSSTSAGPGSGLSSSKSSSKRVSADASTIRKKTPRTPGAVTVAKESEIAQPPKPSTSADPASGFNSSKSSEIRLSADATRREIIEIPPRVTLGAVAKKNTISRTSKRSISADTALGSSERRSKLSERRLSADATRKETAKLPPVTSSSVSKKSKIFHPQQVSKKKLSCSESESLEQPSTSADPALGNADSSAISFCASAVSSQAKSPEPSTSAYPTSALNHQELSSHDSQSESLVVYGAKFPELPQTAVNSLISDENNEFLRLQQISEISFSDDDFPVPSAYICSTSADEIDPIISSLLDPEPSQPTTGSGLSSASNDAFFQELQVGGHVGQKIFEDQPVEAKCPHCSFVTVDLPAFRKHLIKAHSESGERKEHRCPLCHSEYSGRGSLYLHLMLHTGEKPFICYKCQKSFAQKSNLENHIKVCRRKRIQ